MSEETQKILKLTLKKKWFDLIVFGDKREEYREIKPFFLARLTNIKGMIRSEIKDEICSFLKYGFDGIGFPNKEDIKKNGIEFTNYDYVEFSNGYGKNVPTALFSFINVRIGIGNKKWGAPDYPVFILELGTIKMNSHVSNLSAEGSLDLTIKR